MVEENELNEVFSDCGQPCPPDDACDECADYWNRMEQEGYWDPRGKWTNKGWDEITKI